MRLLRAWRSWRLTPRRYHQVTIVALVLLIAIVVSGAAVRLTGSGLGCDDWPNCNDERLIDVSTGHAAIEQVNRLFTGLVSVGVIVAVLGSLRRVPRRRDLTRLSLGLVAGVVAQVLLGGLLVRADLHPIFVQGHLLLSMVLVANAVVLVRRAAEPDGTDRRTTGVSPTAGRLSWLLAISTAVAILTGTVVTGAGPHAGDEDVERLDVTVGAAARLHGISVIAALLVAVITALVIRRRPGDARTLQGPLSTWIFVGLLQAAVGYTQYFNEVPAGLVAIHVAGATALWVVTVWLVMSTTRPAPIASVDRPLVAAA
ncbi:COX15/CtaA family protein [soil metagenome]